MTLEEVYDRGLLKTGMRFTHRHYFDHKTIYLYIVDTYKNSVSYSFDNTKDSFIRNGYQTVVKQFGNYELVVELEGFEL